MAGFIAVSVVAGVGYFIYSSFPTKIAHQQNAQTTPAMISPETPMSTAETQVSAPTPAKFVAMTSRYGLVSTDDDPIHRALFLKGEKVYDAVGASITPLDIYPLGYLDALLFVESGGGSGSFDEFKFLAIQPDGKTKIFEDQQFASTDGGIEIHARANEIVIDLGFQAGKKKQATFNGIALKVALAEPTTTATISAASCEAVFTQALGECAFMKKGIYRTCKDASTNISKVAAGELVALSQNPTFKSRRFVEVCRDACEKGKPPSLKSFKVNVCGING